MIELTEVLRFVLSLATTIVLVKVGEDVIFNWRREPRPKKDKGTQGLAGDNQPPDNLLEIEGVTERMLPVLKDAGYESYGDIELADLLELKRTLATSFPNVSESELKLWMKQASYLVQGKIAEQEHLRQMIIRAKAKAKRIRQ